MIVSIHIPRTRGTLLGTVLDFATGRRVFFDYGADYAHLKAPEPAIARHADFIGERFAAVHGHFHASKYLGLFKEPRFVTCLRHPVDRLISQYLTELDAAAAGQGGWQARLIQQGKMDVVDYAESDDNIRCLQSRALHGVPLADFHQIILYERYFDDLAALLARCGLSRQDPWMSANADLGGFGSATASLAARGVVPPAISEAQRGALYETLVEDVELYIRAKELGSAIERRRVARRA